MIRQSVAMLPFAPPRAQARGRGGVGGAQPSVAHAAAPIQARSTTVKLSFVLLFGGMAKDGRGCPSGTSKRSRWQCGTDIRDASGTCNATPNLCRLRVRVHAVQGRNAPVFLVGLDVFAQSGAHYRAVAPIFPDKRGNEC